MANPYLSFSDTDLLNSAALQKGERDSRAELRSGETGDLLPEDTQGGVRGLTSDGKNDSALLDLDIGLIHSSATTPSSQKFPDNPLTMTHHDHGAMGTSTLCSTSFAVRQLPPELLSQIFMNCRGVKSAAVVLPPDGQFPWALGQVCSYWRQVLWGVSKIWREIRILSDLSQGDQAILPSIVQQIITQVNTLISLEVPILEIGTFTSVVTPHPGRFQSLRLVLCFDLLGIFLNLPLNFFTSLKSLEIAIVRTETLVNPALTHQTGALRKASYLDTFSISYPYHIERLGPTYALSGLWLPWSQLSFFECRGAHSTLDLHDVLSQCVALTQCSVVVRASLTEEVTDDHHPPIVLPHLLVLSIVPFSDGVDWDRFLRPFVLPSLEILNCENWALEAFGALISRSGCRLKELESFMEVSFSDPMDMDMDIEGICTLLRMSPLLVLLGNIPLPSAVFGMMSRGELLPHIATLNCSIELDALDAFLDLMEQFPPGQGIQSAHISLHHVPNAGDDVDWRFISLSERFSVEGRDITMEMIAD